MSQALEEIGADGRNETPLERADRNLVELLQEVRVAQMGVQILFAFLLTVPFTARFPELTSFQRVEYYVTMLAAGIATMLLIAPTAYHRVVFRCGDKEHLVVVANRFTMAGLSFVAVSMVGVLLLVTDVMFSTELAVAVATLAAIGAAVGWLALPVRRRRQLSRRA